MLYTVKYKAPGALFWCKITDVEADGFQPPEIVARFFIRKNGERIEVPCSYIFHFSRERYLSIVEDMNKEKQSTQSAVIGM